MVRPVLTPLYNSPEHSPYTELPELRVWSRFTRPHPSCIMHHESTRCFQRYVPAVRERRALGHIYKYLQISCHVPFRLSRENEWGTNLGRVKAKDTPTVSTFPRAGCSGADISAAHESAPVRGPPHSTTTSQCHEAPVVYAYIHASVLHLARPWPVGLQRRARAEKSWRCSRRQHLHAGVRQQQPADRLEQEQGSNQLARSRFWIRGEALRGRTEAASVGHRQKPLGVGRGSLSEPRSPTFLLWGYA